VIRLEVFVFMCLSMILGYEVSTDMESVGRTEC
jgi:hypothetical protein